MFNSDPNTTYTSPQGRPYRVSGVEKVPNTEKWIGKNLKSHWIVIIKYLDDNTFAKLYHDYKDKIYKIEKL
tara:strand:- start:88 stop:300 length:213 start_codon:yes stop_codon:yes gene_type:complete